MPRAIYLYNSRDFAAIDFFQKLKSSLNGARWELLADFDEGLEGTTGSSFERLAALIRDTDAVIYAIGPLGSGAVQGNFEAGQVLEAQKYNSKLKIVPALVGGASYDLLPNTLRHLTAQIDNSPRGGSNVLAAVFKAVTGFELSDSQAENEGIPDARLSSEVELVKFLDAVVYRAQRRGLTLFVGPYAAADVHGTEGPGAIGSALLKRVTNPPIDITSSDLLAHPWVAAAAARLMRAGYSEVWGTLCNLLSEQDVAPLELDKRISTLARAWEKLGAAPARGYSVWRGLLLVTADHGIRLEKALWSERIGFGRIRCSSGGTIFYEKPVSERGELQFEPVQRLQCHSIVKGTDATTCKIDCQESVLVLKLSDCVTAMDPPPLTTAQHLKVVRERTRLPDPLPAHPQKAPFIMLGGGLLNPIVAHAFIHHFLPNFEQTEFGTADEEEDEVPRRIALHPWPGRADPIRCFEQKADAAEFEWPRRLFKLRRIDWPLPELISRLAYQLVHSPPRVG